MQISCFSRALALALAAFAVTVLNGPAARAQTFGTPVPAERAKAATTTQSPGNGTGYNAVAGLTGGGYVVSWWAVTENAYILAQPFNASGAPIGKNIAVASPADFPGMEQHSAVTGLDDGGFLVVWGATCQSPLPNIYGCIFGRRYDASGTPSGGVIAIDDHTIGAGSSYGAYVASLGNGGFVVTWQNTGSLGVYRRFDANGIALANEASIPGGINGASPRPARLSTGGAVIVTSSGNPGHIFALRLNSDGTQNGSQIQVSTCCTPPTPDPEETSHTVVGTTDGGFVVSWSEVMNEASGWSGNVVARRYDENANPVGGVFPFAVIGAPYGFPSLAALPNGGFVAFWATSAGGHYGPLLGQRFSAANATVGGVFPVGPFGNTLPNYVAGLTGGMFVATWKANNINGDGVIYAQRFRSTGAPLAVADRATAIGAAPATVNVLANDIDPDVGDTLTVTAASAPNGTVVVNPDSTLTYTAGATCVASDLITYTARDSGNLPATGRVTVTRRGVAVMSVTPLTATDMTGPPGGPFWQPGEYQIANTGCAAMNWEAVVNQPWIGVNPSLSGSLAAGATEAVQVFADPDANALGLGNYAGRTTFFNRSGNRGNTFRNVALHVRAGWGADTFANATLLSGASGVVNASNVGATGEVGEPDHAGASGALNSVWWKWIAPASGPVVVHTNASTFDTTLAVYNGVSVDALLQVAANNDHPALGTRSRVAFNANVGTTYVIAVDGAAGATGSIRLAWLQQP